MYYLGKSPDPTCDQIPELLGQAQFFASPEGGRNKQHQKEAAKRAQVLQALYNKCQAVTQMQDQDVQQQIQQIFRPEGVPSSSSKWIWYVAGGLAAVGFGAWFFTRRKTKVSLRVIGRKIKRKIKYRLARRKIGRAKRSKRSKRTKSSSRSSSRRRRYSRLRRKR